jgi:hypothetical protein
LLSDGTLKVKPSVNLAITPSKEVSSGMTLLLEDELLELEIGFDEVVDELLLEIGVLEELLTVLLDELLEVESALVVPLVVLGTTLSCSLVLLEVLLVLPPGILQAANETLANKTNDFNICFFIGLPPKRKIIIIFME